MSSTYYCVVRDIHIYYSTDRRKAAAFRDKHTPGQELIITQLPATYGYTHRIP